MTEPADAAKSPTVSLGPAGVDDLANMASGYLEDLNTAEQRIAELERQRDAVLALCDGQEGWQWSSEGHKISTHAVRAIYSGQMDKSSVHKNGEQS